jgi:membrane associated rhomboid family serine protease
MATCYRHPNRETGVSCSNCGRPICPDCMTPTPVGMRCPECARERTPVRTMRNVRSDPIVTYVLIAINVLAFIGEFASGGGGLATQGGGTVLNDGGLRAVYIDQGEFYRLITSGFLHAGLIHIGFNMFLLYVLGQILEPAVGRVRFLALYFTSLLGGDFGALLVTPDSLTIGASGAVFGLMGAAVLTLRSRGFDPMASGIPALIVFNLVLSFVIPGISIGGHVGGLVAGAAAAYALVEVGERPRLAAAGYAGCALIAAVALAGAILVANGAASPAVGG